MSIEMNVEFHEKMWDDSACQLETEYNNQTPIQKPNTTKEFKNTLGVNKGGLKSFTDWIEQVQSESIPNSSESIEVEFDRSVQNELQKWASAKIMHDKNPFLSIQENMRRISSKDILITAINKNISEVEIFL